MSGEQLISKDNKMSETDSLERETKPKVDINNLLYRVRVEKVKEKRENYLFLGLVVGVLAVTGIIASL